MDRLFAIARKAPFAEGMPIPLVSLLLPIAAILFVLFVVLIIYRAGASWQRSWLFPATCSLAFFLFSLQAILAEGVLGFWTEHTRNLWGNQIWFDLLLAVGVGWFLIVPHAKALGMRLLPWLVLVAFTGSIGFLAMVARMLYLRERAGVAHLALTALHD